MASLPRRVLLIGWAAADWRLLRPLIDSGVMPHLSQLVAAGTSASLRSLQPQFTPLLWASIDTGRGASAHSVLHTMVPAVDGNAMHPLGSGDRACPALWEIAGGHKRRSVVINWPVTYPARPVEGVCVSELFARLEAAGEGIAPPPPGATWPPELATSLDELRFPPYGLTHEELDFFLADVKQAEAEKDPMLTALAVVLAETITSHGVAQELLEQEPWDLAMVRYNAISALGPRFIACMPPQLPYVSDAVFARYQGSVVAMCRYLDLMLGRLLELAGPDTTVLLVSEQGIHTGQLRPDDPTVAFRHLGSPWHREQGILAMRGPAIVSGAQVQGAGLLDIAPTVLQLLGLPAAAGMPGRILREALDPGLQDIPTSGLPLAVGLRQAPAAPLSDVQAVAALAHWRELGLVGDEEPDAAQVRRERNFNLAIAELDARRSRRALQLLEELHRESPEDDRVALHLARCRRRTGDLVGARDLLQQVAMHPDSRPYERMQLAQLQLALGEPDQALMELFRAEQAQGERPAVHCQIGEVYLTLQRWDEAERAFTKALERDADHAASYRGLAATRLGQERYQQCIEASLRAIELERSQPYAHYYLGAALAASGEIALCVQVFLTCLELDADHLPSHRGLVNAYHQLGDTAAAQQHRQRVTQLESVAAIQQQMRSLER